MSKLRTYDAQTFDELIPSAFNSVVIPIDGRAQADLDWKEAQEAARRYQELGIVWEIDLGLRTLPNQTEFLSLVLSLDHFRDTLWKEFQEQTVGLILYRGSAAFDLQTKLSDFERRDVIADYIDLLLDHVPHALPTFVLLNTSPIQDAVHRELLLTRERFEGVQVVTGNGEEFVWPGGFIARRECLIPEPKEETVAICLPSMEVYQDEHYASLKQIFDTVHTTRVIPEPFFTTEWDGLDQVYVVGEAVSPQGKRKLQGFCAAGGTVVTLGEPLGLALEKPYA